MTRLRLARVGAFAAALATRSRAVLFASDRETAPNVTGPASEALTPVMSDRHPVFAMTRVVLWSGRAAGPTAFVAVPTMPPVADAVIHARSGLPRRTHRIAGVPTASGGALARIAAARSGVSAQP